MSAGQVWECADGANRETAVGGAVAAMRRGGLVILPTENSYVVATDAFSLRGTALLRRAKMVPESTPLGLLVASPVVVSGVAARVPRVAKKLMEAFWPGLLTVLLRPQPTLAWDHPKRAPLAVRMPLHPFTLAVCARLGPIAASTATIAGGDAPRTIEEALEALGDDVSGACDVGALGERSWSAQEDPELSSTIVDARFTEVSIAREGAVAAERVQEVLRRLEQGTGDTVATVEQSSSDPVAEAPPSPASDQE